MVEIQIESLSTSVLKVQSVFVRCLTNDQEEYKKDPFHCFYRLKASKAMTSKMCVCGFNVTELESVSSSNLEKKKVKFHNKMTNEAFVRHAIIEDPYGHLISLAEMASKEEFTQIPYYHGFAPE